MNFGVWLPNCRHLATPDVIRSTAVRAEQLGYDSVWVSDHVVVPNANIVNFGETIFDPLGTLAVAAGGTSRVRLGTPVRIVPDRPPADLGRRPQHGRAAPRRPVRRRVASDQSPAGGAARRARGAGAPLPGERALGAAGAHAPQRRARASGR